jgi:thioredoxin-related protein
MSSSRPARVSVILIALLAAGVFAAVTGVVFWGVLSGWFGGPAVVVQPQRPAAGPQAAQVGNDLWIQDFAAAKEKAAREKKDILLSFEGSDWCIWCQRMEREIFSAPEFVDKAPARFVLVKVDFPRDEPARAQVRDPAANENLQRQFGIDSFPAVVLTDAQGQAFGAIPGFRDGGAGPYLDDLQKLQEIRSERDKLFAEVDAHEGAAKLPAIKKTLEFLIQCQQAAMLKEKTRQWMDEVRRLDPKNEGGYLEQLFAIDWSNRFIVAPTDQLPALVEEVARWRKQHGDFKDKERAAYIWMELARGKAELEDFQGAFVCIDEGLKLEPKDPRTRQNLQAGPLALGLGTGTAFAVSTEGHFLTNAHVASGPGKVFLQLPGAKELVQAKIVAETLNFDLALLKIDPPKDAKVQPLPIAGDHVPRRGEEVGAWGYPLGTTFGAGLKLTKGVVSALPEPGTRNMLLLDLRINPGNSGSPLCDAKGNVVGIVTARGQVFPGGGDSYGMALPAKEALAFLGGVGVKSASKPGEQTLTWDEIDRRVSATVAMVIKARPGVKKQ